jgi:glycosyltransferase involved in cell wall biosynthesis
MPVSSMINPLVSVIIPTYNHAHYLCQAVDSVLDQDFDNYEIIVVDDGSQDNTKQVVEDYGSKVRYIYQHNQGLASARNTGIRAAKGDLIALLDADDLYETNYLSTLTSILAANTHAQAVHCASRFVDGNNNPLPQLAGRIVPPENLYHDLLMVNFLQPLCMMAYRRCYEELDYFDKSFPGVEDWDMWLRMASKYTIISVGKVLARYRVVEKSMSTNVEIMLKNRLAVLEKNLNKGISNVESMTEDELEAYSRAYLKAAIESMQGLNQKKAFEYLCTAFYFCPKLLERMDTLNEIFWGEVPRGYRGSYSHINLQKNTHNFFDILSKLFQDPLVSPLIKEFQSSTYSNAYLTLTQVYYGARQFSQMRKYWFHLLRSSPKIALDKGLLPLLGKSLLGRRMFRRIDRYKPLHIS